MNTVQHTRTWVILIVIINQGAEYLMTNYLGLLRVKGLLLRGKETESGQNPVSGSVLGSAHITKSVHPRPSCSRQLKTAEQLVTDYLALLRVKK